MPSCVGESKVPLHTILRQHTRCECYINFLSTISTSCGSLPSLSGRGWGWGSDGGWVQPNSSHIPRTAWFHSVIAILASYLAWPFCFAKWRRFENAWPHCDHKLAENRPLTMTMGSWQYKLFMSGVRYVFVINHSALGRYAPSKLVIYYGNVPHGRDITTTYNHCTGDFRIRAVNSHLVISIGESRGGELLQLHQIKHRIKPVLFVKWSILAVVFFHAEVMVW